MLFRSDLDNDTNFKRLERKLKHFEKEGLIQCEWLVGGFSGAANQQVWSLSDKGAMEIRSELG